MEDPMRTAARQQVAATVKKDSLSSRPSYEPLGAAGCSGNDFDFLRPEAVALDDFEGI